MTRTRRAYLRSIEQQAADQQRRRAQELELAAAAERERITRDIHDSVAHGLSVMVVQAQAAAAGINSDPSSAQESIEAVITTGRQSLAEMRRALGSLSDESDAAHHEPLSRRLTALAEQARATGTPVRLDLDSQLDDLPRELVETAYRVVQESLTNARDHAGATSSVNIVVTRAHGGITVEVTNDGAAVDGFNDGLGINGMRERVRLAGGQLHAGPRQSGGFAVTALLPLSSTPAPTPPARPS
jgi:signal transduction histidine kinase